jgi:hypothetical protein
MAEIRRQDILDFRNHEAMTVAPKSVQSRLEMDAYGLPGNATGNKLLLKT